MIYSNHHKVVESNNSIVVSTQNIKSKSKILSSLDDATLALINQGYSQFHKSQLIESSLKLNIPNLDYSINKISRMHFLDESTQVAVMLRDIEINSIAQNLHDAITKTQKLVVEMSVGNKIMLNRVEISKLPNGTFVCKVIASKMSPFILNNY